MPLSQAGQLLCRNPRNLQLVGGQVVANGAIGLQRMDFAGHLPTHEGGHEGHRRTEMLRGRGPGTVCHPRRPASRHAARELPRVRQARPPLRRPRHPLCTVLTARPTAQPSFRPTSTSGPNASSRSKIASSTSRRGIRKPARRLPTRYAQEGGTRTARKSGALRAVVCGGGLEGHRVPDRLSGRRAGLRGPGARGPHGCDSGHNESCGSPRETMGSGLGKQSLARIFRQREVRGP